MALAKAAVSRNVEEIKKLLEQGFDSDSLRDDFVSSLNIAAKKGYVTIAELLVREDGMPLDDLDKDGRTPLSWAAGNGHKAIVQLLLEKDDIELN